MRYLISVPFSLYFNAQSGMSVTIACADNLRFRSAGQFELKNDNKQDRLRKSAGVGVRYMVFKSDSSDGVVLLPLNRWVDAEWGSESYWSINICRALQNEGIRHIAVCGELDPVARNILTDSCEQLIELGSGKRMNIPGDLSFYYRLWRTGRILAHKNMLIHHVFPMGFSNGFNPLALTKLSNLLIIGPLLYMPSSENTMISKEFENKRPHVTGQSINRPNILYSNKLLHYLHQKTLMSSSHLIFDSEDTRNQFIELVPELKSKKYTIIATGGVDRNVFKPDVTKNKSPNIITIGTVGYLGPEKHIDTVIRAMGLLKDANLKFVVAGEGSMKASLEKLVSDLDLIGKIDFIGRINHSNVGDFHRQIDAFIQLAPAPFEVRASVQEALMSGLPIIVSASPKRIQKAKCLPYGFLVDAVDETTVAEALIQIISNPSFLQSQSEKAREFALEHYSVESVGKRLHRVYTNVTSDFS